MGVSLVLLLSFLVALCFSSFSLFSRTLAIDSESPLAFSLIFGICAGLLCIPLFLVSPWQFNGITISVIAVTFLATFFWGMYDTFQFYARKNVEASRFALFFQLTPIIVLLGSALFLHEHITLVKSEGVALIVLGNLVAIYKPQNRISRQGLLYMFLSVCAVGFAYIADKAVFQHYPVGFYAFLAFAVPPIYVCGIYAARKEPWHNVLQEVKRLRWRLPLLALINVLGYFLFLKTLQIADVSTVVPLIFTSTILTTVGGIVLLGERDNMAQKIIGMLFVFAGIVLLG